MILKFIFSGLTSLTVILRGRDRTVRLSTEHCIVRTLLPQEESEGGKEECEIEEGRQETENRKCFKAGDLITLPALYITSCGCLWS